MGVHPSLFVSILDHYMMDVCVCIERGDLLIFITGLILIMLMMCILVAI